MWVQSVGGEDPLEEGIATHSSIFAWRTPWTEEHGGLQSTESQRVGCDRSDLECTHHAFEGKTKLLLGGRGIAKVASFALILSSVVL